MEFKSGDKVRVHERLIDRREAYGWIPEMNGFENTIQTVCHPVKSKKYPNWYELENTIFIFHEAWLTFEDEKEKGKGHCLLCGSTGYLGFNDFKCDNKSCPNG